MDRPIPTRRISLDAEARRVVLDGRELDLTPIEFDLLVFLHSGRDQVRTHREIIAGIWGMSDYFERHALEVQIGRLRRKLGESGAHPHFISTIRGVGYRFNSAGSEEHVASLVYDADLLLTRVWLDDGNPLGDVPTTLIGSAWIPILGSGDDDDHDLQPWFARMMFTHGAREARLLLDLRDDPATRVSMRIDIRWFDQAGEFVGVGAEFFRTDVVRLAS